MSQPHPVLEALAAVEDALKDVAHVDPTFMSTADKRAALVRQARVEARLKELGLRVQASSGDVAADEAARDVRRNHSRHGIDTPIAS